MDARLFVGLLCGVGLTACARPAAIELQGDLPTTVWSGLPVTLPAAVAVDGEGRPMPDVPVEVTLEPAVLGQVVGQRIEVITHGQGVLRWSVKGGDVTRTAPITLNMPDALQVRCPARGCDLKVGQTLELTAEVRRGTEVLAGAPVVWSNAAAAILEPQGGGRFSAKAAGPTRVTAALGAVRHTVDVRVSATKVEEVNLSCAEDGTGQSEAGKECRVRTGARQPLTLELFGDGQPAFGFEPKWTVEDKTIARMNEGTIQGLKVGRTKLQVEVGGATASLDIDVWPPACSEKVESQLTYRMGYRGVRLHCRLKDPEACIEFFVKRKWGVVEAVQGCCCGPGRW